VARLMSMADWHKREKGETGVEKDVVIG
jgi:hypothetical protein